jgi:hypothetical protein
VLRKKTGTSATGAGAIKSMPARRAQMMINRKEGTGAGVHYLSNLALVSLPIPHPYFAQCIVFICFYLILNFETVVTSILTVLSIVNSTQYVDNTTYRIGEQNNT